MPLPRSVQQQADAAKQHFESLQNPEPPAPESETKAPEAPEAAQPAEPPAQPDDEKHSQGDNKPDEPKRSEAYWEHRFNVINGKYAAEVPALRDEVRSLKKQVSERDQKIDGLISAAKQEGNNGGLTDEQMAKFEAEFGEDFVSFVQRMVSSSASKSDNSAEVNELKRKVETFEQREQQKTTASFWTALNELVPDWKTVNDDKAFHTFLSQYDPQTGEQRQQTLNAAQQALDADGVAAVFDAFKKQQPKPEKTRIPDDQVDPPTSRSTTTPDAGRIWTGPEIKQFYTDKANGKYSAEEGKRLEADIFAAQREGRVR
jgi:hypothetical protein